MNFKDTEVVLFDLDGTLTDSEEGIINSLKYVFEKYNFTDYNKEKLKRFLGPPLQETFSEVLGLNKEEVDKAVAVFREYFSETGIYENKLYSDVERLLKILKDNGKTILLATSKAEQYAVRVLEHFGLAKYFTVIGGSSFSGSRSRKGDVIKYTLKEAGICEPYKAVMIGDRKHDVNGAKEASIPCIGVLYGYGSKEELNGAGVAAVAESINELIALLV